MDSKFWLLENEQCSLQIEKLGGNMVDFHLKGKNVNPLNFKMLHQSRYHEDFCFKGHFLCLGRWGDPSPGEMANGLNKHGEFLRTIWEGVTDDHTLHLFASSNLEGLSLKRKIELSTLSSGYKVTDQVYNKNDLGRMYQVVQHPTIARPFLNENTMVDCNASSGFDYAFEKYECAVTMKWPNGYTKSGLKIKLNKPDSDYSSVFPFIVNPDDEYGWLTAFSPDHQLLLAYIWKRKDYPWINHWLHWEEDETGLALENTVLRRRKRLLYRGLEFGNTGIHKPFNKILSENLLNILGESSVDFIDAAETHTRTFYSFIHSPPGNFKGVEKIQFKKNKISIYEKTTNKVIVIPHTFN